MFLPPSVRAPGKKTPDLPRGRRKTREKFRRPACLLDRRPTARLFFPVASVNLRADASEETPGDLPEISGSSSPVNDLMPLVYEELRRMAHRHMAQERPNHTMQATALVNEVYLKLKHDRPEWQNRAHFFALAAQMMRQILIDYARRHTREKRGGGAVQVTLDEAMWIAPEKSEEMLAVDDAFNDSRRSTSAAARSRSCVFSAA